MRRQLHGSEHPETAKAFQARSITRPLHSPRSHRQENLAKLDRCRVYGPEPRTQSKSLPRSTYHPALYTTPKNVENKSISSSTRCSRPLRDPEPRRRKKCLPSSARCSRPLCDPVSPVEKKRLPTSTHRPALCATLNPVDKKAFPTSTRGSARYVNLNPVDK